jgi:hypothetical protein
MEATEANQTSQSRETIEVHEVVQTMTHIINYLSVSLYESQFTKNHEDAYSVLHSIYDSVCLKPSALPSLHDIKQFYDNVVYLGDVTYTDDPDYYTYKIKLRKYITYYTGSTEYTYLQNTFPIKSAPTNPSSAPIW